jgi:phospholipase/lecithinase/hemolysin
MVKLSLSLAAVVVATVASEALAKGGKDQLFVVGDSLSDNGNLKQLTSGAYPVNRRAGTSHAVWNEYWALKNGFRLRNQAFYSATLDSSQNVGVSGQKDNWPIMGVVQQIDSLHYSRKFERCQAKKDAECVLAIFGGANDFSKEITKALTLAATTQTEPDFSAIPVAIASYLDTALARAVEYGVPKIIVANAWPGTKSPLAATYPADIQALGQYIEPIISGAMEQVIAKYAAQVEGTGTQIVKWDVYATASNFIDTTTLDKTPCLNFQNYIELNRVEECENPEDRLWWDGVHAGREFHIQLARSFAEAVTPLLPKSKTIKADKVNYATEYSVETNAAASAATAASSLVVAVAAMMTSFAN